MMASVTDDKVELDGQIETSSPLIQPQKNEILKVNLSAEDLNKLEVESIKNSELFKINKSTLVDNFLATNQMFKNLINRLEAFYVLVEQKRKIGIPLNKQESLNKSIYSFGYQIELHKSLKRLIKKVIIQKDLKVKSLFLKEVYGWFVHKLFLMGVLSKFDLEAENRLMNPNKRSMS